VRRTAPLLALVVALGLAASSAVARVGPAPTSTPPPTPVPPHASPSPFPTALATPPPGRVQAPTVGAESAILEDLGTGQVLYAKRVDVPRPIASVTKIMTADLALRRLHPGTLVTVGPEAAALGSHDVGISELGLREGERLTVEQLLEALLLQSANDAAVALADAVSPSTDAFIALMNRTAKRMGLRHTVFFSPNGLDDRGHSTARSLATLTRTALQLPLFASLVRTKFATIPAPTGVKPRKIQNRNVLLWLYPGATGVKTGFTDAAGYCLVAAATKKGHHLVAVLLKDGSSQQSFNDGAALLNYGFNAFRRQVVLEPGQIFPVTAGGIRYQVASLRSISARVPMGETSVFSVNVSSKGPLAQGQRAGVVIARVNGLVVGRAPVKVTAVLGPVPHPTPPAGPPRAGSPPWLVDLGRAAAGLYHSVFG
jgi:serine-type D-Ala-D-Ala carboxypeptidase (penicillin-binding protein 5/6)